MREQTLQRKIIKFLEQQGCYVVKVITATKAGVPDILACYKGKFIAIEVKVGNNKPSKLQEYNIRKIKESKGYAIVAYSLEDVKKLLKEVDTNETI